MVGPRKACATLCVGQGRERHGDADSRLRFGIAFSRVAVVSGFSGLARGPLKGTSLPIDRLYPCGTKSKRPTLDPQRDAGRGRRPNRAGFSARQVTYTGSGGTRPPQKASSPAVCIGAPRAMSAKRAAAVTRSRRGLDMKKHAAAGAFHGGSTGRTLAVLHPERGADANLASEPGARVPAASSASRRRRALSVRACQPRRSNLHSIGERVCAPAG